MKKTGEYILIIPDVHGRTFWRDAVDGHKEGKIVFLGDYLDPYGREGITPDMAFAELEAIVEFKKENMDRVVLLLGNHDLGYLDECVCECRHDWYGAERNGKFLKENLGLFNIAHECVVDGQKVLFSHAGVRDLWVMANGWLFGNVEFTPELLNRIFHHPKLREDLMPALAQVSFYRGGGDPVSSPVWADMYEFIDTGDFLPGYLHVFGHTLHSGGPVHIKTDNAEGWCLDCAEAFLMDGNGNISSRKKSLNQER